MITIHINAENAEEARQEMQKLLGDKPAEREVLPVPEYTGEEPVPARKRNRKKTEEAVKEEPGPVTDKGVAKCDALEPEKEEPVKAELTEEQKVEIRTKAAEYCHKHADGKAKIKAYLAEQGASKVTELQGDALKGLNTILED